MGIKRSDSKVRLGRSRSLMDLSASVDQILAEIARWHVDPKIDANNLFDGEIYETRAGNGSLNASSIEVLWLPRAGQGAVYSDGRTQWAGAESPDELLERWATDSLDNAEELMPPLTMAALAV